MSKKFTNKTQSAVGAYPTKVVPSTVLVNWYFQAKGPSNAEWVFYKHAYFLVCRESFRVWTVLDHLHSILGTVTLTKDNGWASFCCLADTGHDSISRFEYAFQDVVDMTVDNEVDDKGSNLKTKKPKYVQISISELRVGDKFRVVKPGLTVITNRSDSSGSSKFNVSPGSKCLVRRINPKSVGAHVLKYGDGSVDVVDPMTWHTCFPKDLVVEVKRKLWKSLQTDEE